MKFLILLYFLSAPFTSSAGEPIIESTEKYGKYTVYTQLNDKECDIPGCDRTLFIHKDNKKIFELEGYPPTAEYYPANSSPFNTKEKPILLVQYYSGGAHCCSTFYLVEMGKNFKQLQKIEAGDNENIIDKNKEIRLFDPIFSYFYTSFAYSPMPKVYLKFENDKLIFDKKKMKKPCNDTEFNKMLADLDQKIEKDLDEVELASKFLGNTIDLVYSGNVNRAWKLVDEFFAKGNTLIPPLRKLDHFSSADLKRQILCKMTQSLYAKEVEEINEGNLKLPTDCSEEELRMPSAF